MKPSTAAWRKASRSTSNGGDCVEVANIPGFTVVRDSKDPYGPVLAMKRNDFQRFAEALKNL
ncbi:DUF397 domain-containing protein [Actinomadura bangladeshensis]|uniref:DUF397 domain-containing protein n=1 Tax=Actinomadura bangladeshensis TaxID=453573 RepID=A0A6L9QEM6_9ACTN|nr:DUF397 domain-containing protein [Actinomadura bangladeshensis]NEA23890.1 DUF397 domain-containing protein [Actinomadura bangladeshensis]